MEVERVDGGGGRGMQGWGMQGEDGGRRQGEGRRRQGMWDWGMQGEDGKKDKDVRVGQYSSHVLTVCCSSY